MSKATLVLHAEFFAADESLLKRLRDPAWNPRTSILLEDTVTASLPPSPTAARISDHVNLKTYTPTEIKIEAQSAQGGYVFINDQYDPDWQAQVNGHVAPILRADYIMRAVPVPPGESVVTMHYIAHYHVTGLNLPAEIVNNFSDGTMLAAWLVAGFALWRRKPQVSS